MKKYVWIFFFLASCGSQMGVQYAASSQKELEEARIALLDVRHALGEHQIELRLLEEKVSGENPSIGISNRIENLEKNQRRILEDLKKIQTHANEVTEALVQYRSSIETLEKELQSQSSRLNEVVKLKSTLNSISKAIGQSSKVHKVVSGDSLDKIARMYNTSVQSLKQANGLTNNTIVIGQEIKIP